MKTFRQFLEQQSHNAKELVDDFTYEMGYPLFRGMNIKVDSGIFDHPKSRVSVDSDAKLVLLFNSMVDAAFNIPNIRSSSIFCTGYKTEAEGYGQVYKIAPIGDYKFIWSPKVRDSYSGEHIIWHKLESRLNSHTTFNVYMKDLFLALTAELKDSDWVHTTKYDDIVQRIALEKFEDANYPLQYNGIDEFPKLLKLSLKETAEELYQTTDMENAINSSNEIIIYKSDGYAAVRFVEDSKKKEEDDTPF
jgi:hypothetical protein